MKKFIILSLIIALITSFKSYHSNFFQYECIQVGITSKVKLWSPNKGIRYKFNDALKNAVELVLFEGVNGEKCSKQSPLLKSSESKDKFKKIEETFFSKNGDFSKFVNLVSKETENKGVKNGINIPVYVVSISTQELESYLTEKEILSPLNKGF